MFTYRLTTKQKSILRFLTEHHRNTGIVPSVREVQKHFAFGSSNSVAQHLSALEKKGYLKRSPGKARSLQFAAAEKQITTATDGSLLQESSDQLFILPLDDKPAQKPEELAGESTLLDDKTKLLRGDALEVMRAMPPGSVHAIVTDPPYGLIEYENGNHDKLRRGRGGVWRIPPTLDGVERAPLPRFTVLTSKDRERLFEFFVAFGALARRILKPGGHIMIASNPLLSTLTFSALIESGLEKRGEIIRLVKTLRGGDRPKGAETEFSDVSAMPRSCWEPWGLFRTTMAEGTVAENLRKHAVGGLRRTSREEPFKDLVECGPARGKERTFAPHPSLKPQRLLRYLVRASLPLGRGVVLDPFAGSGSTLAAASALGYESIGIERDTEYYTMAANAFPKLKALKV